MTLEEPIFLQNLGRVTISFALLEGALTSLTPFFGGTPKLEEVAREKYNRKVQLFVEAATREFERLGGTAEFDQAFFRQLRADLNGVAAERNRLIHDFWTLEAYTQRMRLKSLKGDAKNDVYPTSEYLRRLSDRIYDVRSRLAPVANEYMRLRANHAETQQSQSNG